MQLIKTFIFLILSTLFLIHCAPSPTTEPDAYDSHGHPITLSQYKGKWVLINFWASWCTPCLQEMPTLNKLYQSHKARLVVLGVSYDALSNDEINQFAKKYTITYPMLSKFPLKKLKQNNLPVLPMTFIFNPQGKLAKILKGPQTEKAFLANIKKD